MSNFPRIEEEEEVSVNQPHPERLSTPIVIEMVKFYAQHAKETKDKGAKLGAEVTQRQEKIKFLHGIIQELNACFDEKNGLEIGKNAALQDKLKVAREMGAEIPTKGKEDKVKTSFTPSERDRLFENLRLKAEELNQENKMATQQMQVLMQEGEKVLMLANQSLKCEGKVKSTIIKGIH